MPFLYFIEFVPYFFFLFSSHGAVLLHDRSLLFDKYEHDISTQQEANIFGENINNVCGFLVHDTTKPRNIYCIKDLLTKTMIRKIK